MRIIDYQSDMYNRILDDTTKGFIDETDLSKYKDNCSSGTILNGMEYRPDLVAEYYLGDSTLAWLITYVNNFTEGIRDYTLGRTIKIPSIS